MFQQQLIFNFVYRFISNKLSYKSNIMNATFTKESKPQSFLDELFVISTPSIPKILPSPIACSSTSLISSVKPPPITSSSSVLQSKSTVHGPSSQESNPIDSTDFVHVPALDILTVSQCMFFYIVICVKAF